MTDATDSSISPRDMRVDYRQAVLLESQVAADPLEQFRLWFDDARAAGIPEINAMTLATADADGAPSARIVLLKEFDRSGFTFYTNYNSHKGADLQANPRAALVFFWVSLERQVRITGNVERVSREQAADYFHSRPALSQIGAWASHQSHVIQSREELDHREAELEQQFAGQAIPLPDFWGGYRVIPNRYEFWQGRTGRLHDRIEYLYTSPNGWKRQRLAP